LLTRLCHFHEKYGGDCQLIVADDASTDGTPAEIKRQFPAVVLVENDQNRGFGANLMTGVAVAENEYLATLNSDIVLYGNPFKELIEELERDQRLFAAMPLVFNRRLDKVENLARLYCHRGLCWHRPLPEEEHWSAVLRDLMEKAADVKSRLRDVAGRAAPIRSVLCGAAFVCRREQFLALGGFDPRFQPFYWEDVDLDYRARERGLHCAVVPCSAVIHRHSETIDRWYGKRKVLFLRLNQLRFVQRHVEQLIQAGLRAPHLWWAARAVKECFGEPALRRAYFRASLGATDF
jgi:GT2 family glycosyltransferase